MACRAQVARPSDPMPLSIPPASDSQPLVPALSSQAPEPVHDERPGPVSLKLIDPADGQTSFPILLTEPSPKSGSMPEPEPCASTRPEGADAKFDAAWLARCLGGELGRDGRIVAVHRTPAEIRSTIERANRALYENGYVNSGWLVRPGDNPDSMNLQLVRGQLVAFRDGKPVPCAFAVPSDGDARRHRYVERRLMQGCSSNQPFNVYALERNFRRLADHRQTSVGRLDLRLEAVCNQNGLAVLGPRREEEGSCVQPGQTGQTAAGRIAPLPGIELIAGLANSRAPSIGSDRGYIAATLRPMTGLLVEGEAGITKGALDGSAGLSFEAAPRWTAGLRADANTADVVDPALRPLDIRSRGWGAEASISYGAIQCPLTPLYGDGQSREARTAYLGDGLERCRLAARKADDSPVGWSAGHDLAVSLALSHRESTSFLLGRPFSFSPGALDGKSRVTALRGTVDWLVRGRAGRSGERGWTLAARFQLTQGIDGSATDIAGIAGPEPGFTLMRLQMGYARELGVAGLVFSARLNGQLANGPLYTAERFAIGGVESVRGYAEASLLADSGITASVRLNKVVSLDRNRNSEGLAGDDPYRFRLGAFLDAGRGTTIARGPNISTDLASAGVSLAWIPADWIELRADYARHLTAKLPFTGDSLAERGVHFSLTIEPLKLLKLRQRRRE